jgi:hypothetical protein
VIASLAALWVFDWRADPAPEQLMKVYLTKPEAETKRTLVANLVESWEYKRLSHS